MKRSFFLVLLATSFFVIVMAQPDEETLQVPIEDLQTDEETTQPDEEPTQPDEEPTQPDEEATQPDEEPTQTDEEASSEPDSEYTYYEHVSYLIPDDPSIVLEEFYHALQSGNSEIVTYLISSDALESVDIMLDALKESIERDEELIMGRLTAAGYTATADEIDDWSALDYLTETVVLPVMKARYTLYEMQIEEYSNDGDDIVIPLLFISSTGLELPFEAELVREDDFWKVTTFMGLNAFP